MKTLHLCGLYFMFACLLLGQTLGSQEVVDNGELEANDWKILQQLESKKWEKAVEALDDELQFSQRNWENMKAQLNPGAPAQSLDSFAAPKRFLPTVIKRRRLYFPFVLKRGIESDDNSAKPYSTRKRLLPSVLKKWLSSSAFKRHNTIEKNDRSDMESQLYEDMLY